MTKKIKKKAGAKRAPSDLHPHLRDSSPQAACGSSI